MISRRGSWHRAAFLLAIAASGCSWIGAGPLDPFADLITDAQPVDPGTLPALATERGYSLTSAAPLTGGTVTVGLSGPSPYRIATIGSGSSSGTGSAGDISGRRKGIAEWTVDSLQFQPVRIEAHQSSSTPAESSPAVQEDGSTGNQDADRNEASSSGGKWIDLPASNPAGGEAAAADAGASGFAAVDLVKLATAGAAFQFGTVQLPAGHYDQIRFWGANTRAGKENANNRFHALDASGRERSGVYKLPGQLLIVKADFDIRPDQATGLAFSLDPHEALKIHGRRVILRPTSVTVSATYTAAPVAATTPQ